MAEELQLRHEQPDQQQCAPQYPVNQGQQPKQGYPQQYQVSQGQPPQQGFAQQYSVNDGPPPQQGCSPQYLVNQQTEAMAAASMAVEPSTTTIARQGQVQPPDFLVLSVVVLVCCFLPLGIVALIHSLEVGSRHRAGDMDGALEASKSAKKWADAGLAVGVTIWIVSLIAKVSINAVAASAAAAAAEDTGYHG